MISPIHKILQNRANTDPDAPAILEPERTPTSYKELFDHVNGTIEKLNELGIGRNDRVAIVLPNGSEMATAFLSIASGATSAPLNPNYRAQEYEFYLTDLDARVLIVLQTMDSPSIDVANQLNIPVIHLVPDLNEKAGIFSLEGPSQTLESDPGPAKPEDVALVLHTSGTTSRPKIVPLTHTNICATARNIQQTLKLTPEDRCLNVMPLFHIHGLMAATLSSMRSGASLVCTSGFYAPQFFPWLDEFNPTWYTAVPTMHQAILSRAPEHQKVLDKVQLRFVRSSSSSLPPQVMDELEKTFNAPVVEAYGMTEAAHQMACNQLPPLDRKPGSVGPAAGPEVAIMAEDSNQLLESGKIGEIVIQGENVTLGYANNPEANASAFTDGWFRTGDQGYMDEDGYFYITGRLKEIINRGGEKISPREIDEVLLSHPSVKQSLAFALPDPKLGEDVAAAVVLKDDSIGEKELRKFVSLTLADFKVPRRIVILDEIPKGPTGKLQRIGLAEKLGIGLETQKNTREETEFVLPSTPVEEFLAEIWESVLNASPIGVHHQFLELGGDSMLATQLVSRVQDRLDVQISLIDFFDAPTIAEQAVLIEDILLEEADGAFDDH